MAFAESTFDKLQPFIDSSLLLKRNIFLRCLFEFGAFSLILICITILIASVLVGVNILDPEAGHHPIILVPLNLVWAFVFIMMMKGFVHLRRRARTYTPLVLEQLKHDTRDPILYLRTFYEQGESIWRADSRSTEEVLVSALKDVGPVIAVGRPGEKVPPPGGFRVYIHENWEEKVKGLMAISQLVVIDAWFSHGLETEIATSVSTVSPEKLIISFLSWDSLHYASREDLYENFRTRFKDLTGISLPENMDHADFIQFDGNWTPHLINIDFGKRLFWGLLSFSLVSLCADASALAVKQSLRAALKDRGLSFKSGQQVAYVCALGVATVFAGLLVLFIALLNIRFFSMSI